MGNIKKESEFSPEKLKQIKKVMSQFPQPAKEYDSNGIKYPLDFLNSVGLSIIFLPLEYQATFVDAVTLNNLSEIEKDALSIVPANVDEAVLGRFNATTIGNFAYITLHGENEKAREICMAILEKIYVYFKKVAEAAIAKMASKHGIN